MADVTDPRKDILEIEAKVREICERNGRDPAEGTMILLVAAAHITDTYSPNPTHIWARSLAHSLGDAIVAADEFFTLKRVPNAGGRS